MAAGAAGAPGQLAEEAPRKGGENAIILNPKMEALPVQGGKCRPRLAEGLRAQTGTEAADITTCTDPWMKMSFSSEETRINMDFFFSCQLPILSSAHAIHNQLFCDPQNTVTQQLGVEC